MTMQPVGRLDEGMPRPAPAVARSPQAGSARIATGLGILGLALAALSLVFRFEDLADGIPDLPYWSSNAFGTLPMALLGAILLRRHPEHTIGRLFAVGALFAGLSAFTGEYGPDAALGAPGRLPGGVLAEWLGNWTWWLVFIPIVLVLFWFPTGRFASSRWRIAGYVGVAGLLLATLGDALMPGSMRLMPGPNPLGVAGASYQLNLFRFAGSALVVTTGSAAIVGLVLRLRGASQLERQQLKWLAFGGGVSLFLLVGALIGDGALGVRVLGPIAGLVGFGWIFPGTIAVAIVRYRLWDIDLLINRTLVYATLTVGVVALYVGVVGTLGALLRSSGNPAISLAAAGVVAVAFEPFRARFQRGVNHLLYGERDEPYRVLSRLGQRLEATLSPDAVLPTIAQTLTDALKLPYAAITVLERGEYVAGAARGTPSGDVLRLPLVYQGEVVGELRVGSRAPGEEFSSADQRLLGDLARQAGIAIHAVLLTARLQEALTRLVTAREEERRRLRRDLHDGLGPVLASQPLTLETARKLIHSDPATAVALLDELVTQSKEAVADIRRLVYALRPPALDDLGLIPALREQAAQYAPTGLKITVESPEVLPPLPAAVEVAAYRIVQEALTNVVRHAHAQRCVIRVVPDEGAGLRIDVADDGQGLPRDRRAGVGTTSMRERAEELGGVCQVETGPRGGTIVRAHLPMSKEGLWTASAS